MPFQGNDSEIVFRHGPRYRPDSVTAERPDPGFNSHHEVPCWKVCNVILRPAEGAHCARTISGRTSSKGLVAADPGSSSALFSKGHAAVLKGPFATVICLPAASSPVAHHQWDDLPFKEAEDTGACLAEEAVEAAAGARSAVAERNALQVLWHDVPIAGSLSVVRYAKT
jgi:hypothetical protein